MKKLFSFAAPKPLFLVLAGTVLFIGNANADLLLYDGFDYPSGQLLAPTDPTAGQNNTGYGVNWWYAGAAGNANPNAPGIASGGLSYAGRSSTGNSVIFDMSQVGTARIQVAPTAISSGTVYWSGLLRVNSINNLTTGANGMLLGGFNNSSEYQGTSVSTVNAVLRIRQDSTDPNVYHIGTGMNSGTGTGTSANVQFDNATGYGAGETVFVVGSYEFVDGANNDIARMWINPDQASFGEISGPSATLTSSPGPNIADGIQVLSFDLRNINTVGSPTVQFDELRVGTTWADVTAVPEPSAGIFGSFIAVAFLSWRRFRKP